MSSRRFRVAGWVAVLAVAAFIAEITLSFATQIPAYTGLVSPYWIALVLAIHVSLASYATYRLREFLNTKYEFHGVDTLIPLLIGSGIMFALVLIGAKLYLNDPVSIFLLLGLGIPLGLFSALFGYRLLRINGSIGGYKKPFAYSHMIAPLCFLSVVLAPVGLLLLLASETILALMLLGDASEELEFV